MSSDLEQQCINTLRFLSADMVEKAGSGHPGMPLGAATMAYVLWTRYLKHHPKNPAWADRDRFVLSAGHGSALLYSLLFVTGYGLSLEDLRAFRQWQSRTPGHPEREKNAGVEVTTGPLGQGFANAVGMAIGEAQLAALYNRDGHKVIDHRTFAIVSDGDLMEGVASEAASLAGHLQLGKLVCLYDDNEVTLAAPAAITFTEDRARRFEAYGWQTISVADGNDVAAIDAAISSACADRTRPSLIVVRTHLGFGSPVQDSYKAHGSPLGAANLAQTKEKLGWPTEPAFIVPEAALAFFREAVARGERAEAGWKQAIEAYAQAYPELAEELTIRLRGELPPHWGDDLPVFAADEKGTATRVAGGRVMNAIAPKLPALFGGSADLDPSTHTALKGLGDFGPDAAGEAGRNLHFGVREHAMGAIVNGLAAHGGFIPFGATFLIFSDYMRPPIRLAALSGLHIVHVFTHDSIALGEDGPTHQPVEQLANLRAIPGVVVIRPADANETAVAWQVAVETRDRPVLLVLTRQDVPTLDRNECADAQDLRRGGYVLRHANGPLRLILIASGSEVALIVAAAKRLAEEGIHARCVSLPSWELFAAQPQAYRDEVLPPAVKTRLAVEAGCGQGWERYVGERGDFIGVERFGASAPGEVLLREYGFTVENVLARARKLLAQA
jgi:transketolase